MSFPPQFHPPGGFDLDTSTSPGQPLHANIFRPPPSPTASTYNLAKSTGSLLSDISMSAIPHTGTAKRKRARTRESTPLDWHMNMEGAFDGREEERSRESRYTLAGEISTTPAVPAVGAVGGVLDDSVYSDVDYRRALGPKEIPGAESPSTQIPFDRTSNAPSAVTWSLFSLQTIGDMVGKVWEFCTKGAFRGFQAGGGQRYNLNGATVTETTGQPWGPELDTPIQPHPEDTPMAQATPSYFPQPAQTPSSPVYHELSTPVYHEFTTPDSTPQPAAKRRQVSANNDELRNWVVVDEPNNQPPKRFAAEVKAAAARTSGLARPRPSYSFQTSASAQRRTAAPSQRFTGGTPTLSRIATRPSLRISQTGSPNLAPREPASFASPRSSPLSGSTPSRIPVAVPTQSPAQQSHNHNPFAVPSAPFSASTPRAAASRPASRPASRHTTRQSLGSNSTNIFATTSHNLRPASPSKLSGTGHRRNRSSMSASPHPAAATTVPKPAARRQSILARQQPQPQLHPQSQSQSQQQQHSQTTTSPRLDAEARHLAQRKLAAERDADAKVDAFNARLLSMIRQGREALGTRVEVEMDGDDDGDVGMGMDFGSGVGGGGGGGGVGGGWEDDD